MADREVEEITAKNQADRKYAEEMNAHIEALQRAERARAYKRKRRQREVTIARLLYWMSGVIGGVTVVYAVFGQALYAYAGVCGMALVWMLATAFELDTD